MQLPDDIDGQLDRRGYARIPGILSPNACDEIASYWEERERFRSEIVMARHGYGDGSYRYFADPLPAPIDQLRQGVYAPLACVANLWQERLGIPTRFPAELDRFLEECAAAGQMKPTPLLLRYEEGGYNRLHQDRYGEIAFPLQLVVLLTRPGLERDGDLAADEDFRGGEFLLTEGRPRMQSKGTVLSMRQGDAIVFPNQIRPVESTRGYARAAVRHGVSEVTKGVRMALGVIFHGAK